MNAKTNVKESLQFFSIGMSLSFFESEGHSGLIKDYQSEANHLSKNLEPLTDETSFTLRCSNEFFPDLKVSDMVTLLSEEVDSVTSVFKALIKDIPEKSVDRVKETLKTCETLHELIYCTKELSAEELEMTPYVEIELEFEFETPESSNELFGGTINVSMSIVPTGSLEHLKLDSTLLPSDNNAIVNAPIEWFYSNTREDFKPFTE